MSVQDFLREVYGQDLWDLLAFICGVIYVFLVARGKWTGWLWGILSCSIVLWKDIVQYRLLSDALLQLYYIGMGMYAVTHWRRALGDDAAFSVRELPWYVHFIIIVVGLFLGGVLGQWMGRFGAALIYLDGVTTVLSILATILMVYRVRSNWWYWIVTDALYIYMYLRQGALFFATLMAVYLGFAVYGLYRWSLADTEVGEDVIE